MRAAVIFGLGTSPAALEPFQSGSRSEWVQGLPASSSEADVILVFGGDGTIHRHLAALVRLQLPVLVVPAGSGNDFARALKLRSPSDSLRLWRDFESGKTEAHSIDLGMVTQAGSPQRAHYFCCVAGCGLDSAAARRANEMPRWLRARGGYVLAAVSLLPDLPAFCVRLIQFNGNRRTETETPALLVAFANTQFYGDGMRVAPEANFTDGKLDICRIATMNPLRLLYLFPTVYLGRHLLSSKVTYSRAERVVVETGTPMEIYADGEQVCETPVEISVAARALRVIYEPS